MKHDQKTNEKPEVTSDPERLLANSNSSP